MAKSKTKLLTAAAALVAVAAPSAALAQVTGTRLPSNVTVVDPLVVQGAIDDGTQTQPGEEARDAGMADLPAVYEAEEPADTPEAAAELASAE